MLKAFEELTKNVKWKPKRVSIDNHAFKLHYRLSFGILCVCAVLVTSRQYIGEHIRCIGGKTPEETKVRETYCFFTSTYTVARHYEISDVEIAHPGVGPVSGDEGEPIIRHAYYQWVPFVLFLQALFFYGPHLLWKVLEGSTIKALVNGLEYASLALDDKDRTINDSVYPSKKTRSELLSKICGVFRDRIEINRFWAARLVFCEFLNFVNVMFQILFTDMFLGGQFLQLGLQITDPNFTEANPLDIVFPKVTKCNFPKYGPSGTIQILDCLCVMALNVINEKIYVFLWFWFLILAVVSLLALLWRFFTFVLQSRSEKFNLLFFRMCLLKVPPTAPRLAKQLDFSNWLFLYYLARNLDVTVFAELFDQLEEELMTSGSTTPRKSIGQHSDEEFVPLQK